MPTAKRSNVGTTGPGGKFDSTGNQAQVIAHRKQVVGLLADIGIAGYNRATSHERVFLDDCRVKMKQPNPTFGWRQVQYLVDIKGRVAPTPIIAPPSSKSSVRVSTRSPSTGP